MRIEAGRAITEALVEQKYQDQLRNRVWRQAWKERTFYKHYGFWPEGKPRLQ